MTNLLKLTKKKLEELGRENGIELDRRKSKAALVEELEDYLCKCGKTEDENGLCDGSHAKKEEAPLETTKKVLRDETGAIITFPDSKSAKGAGHRAGGRAYKLNGSWVVKLY